MCWVIKKTEYEANPSKYHKVAKEDIIVYKIGKIKNKKFIPSFHHTFEYESKVTNKKNTLKFQAATDYTIEEGYHSYSKECSIEKDLNLFSTKFILSVYRKIKCHDMLVEAYLDSEIGKFIIPKGTEYYENEYGEIVSSQIVWTGECMSLIELKKNSHEPIKFKDLRLCVGV